MLRGAAVVTALVLINLFSWDGYFWAIWPAGALGFAALMRRTRKRT
ncbi:hypothetical protein [Shimia sp. MIT910701]